MRLLCAGELRAQRPGKGRLRAAHPLRSAGSTPATYYKRVQFKCEDAQKSVLSVAEYKRSQRQHTICSALRRQAGRALGPEPEAARRGEGAGAAADSDPVRGCVGVRVT